MQTYGIYCFYIVPVFELSTRKPSCRWQTRATRKFAKNAPIRRENKLQTVNDLFEVLDSRCL